MISSYHALVTFFAFFCNRLVNLFHVFVNAILQLRAGQLLPLLCAYARQIITRVITRAERGTPSDEDARRRGQIILDRFPALAVEAYHIDNVIHAVRPNHITRQHEHLTRVAVTEAPSLLEVPLPLGKLLFEAEHDVLQGVRDRLIQEGWDRDYELIFSGKTLLEMTAKGANKGGMVLRLARRLGVAPEHVYCVGDEANDIPMLTAAAQGFAPANCVEAVRQCGATVVSDARCDALADVVEILSKKYQ